MCSRFIMANIKFYIAAMTVRAIASASMGNRPTCAMSVLMTAHHNIFHDVMMKIQSVSVK